MPEWKYVMIEDPARTMQSLWKTNGFISMIGAKYEDFQYLGGGRVCIYVDETAFDHPVNKAREYLKVSRRLGDISANEFIPPKGTEGDVEGLQPVILGQGECLYIASPIPGRPCEHGWNEHPQDVLSGNHACVAEYSAVPLVQVPLPKTKYRSWIKGLIPAAGSADMTTDWFGRRDVSREPLLESLFAG